jgi:hypothetical protein
MNLGNKKVFVDCEGNHDFKSGEYPDGYWQKW